MLSLSLSLWLWLWLWLWLFACSHSPTRRSIPIWSSTWAVYCSHAISHGRWSALVGGYGSDRFNAALALCNAFTLFGVYPNYWLFHNRHHTHLGQYPLLEARERAARGLPTDGDIGLSRVVLHSAPSRKYTLALTAIPEAAAAEAAAATSPQFLPRLSEPAFQSQSLLLHLLAPLLFVGSAASRLRAIAAAGSSSVAGSAAAGAAASAATGANGANGGAINRGIAVQSLAQLSVWALVVAVCASTDSWWPFAFYVGSQALWLSPLNLNWLWTCPHLCEEGSGQPTVSFYTPDSPLGGLLDAYMGWENYHVEHHDFPDVPMYLLPKLRGIAPEEYDPLRCMPVLEPNTWRQALGGEYFYACQDATFGGAGSGTGSGTGAGPADGKA